MKQVPDPRSLLDALPSDASTRPALLGIGSGGDSSMSAAELRRFVSRVQAGLNDRGFGRGKVLALSAAGPLAPAVLLAAVQTCTCAPINPALTIGEAEAHLSSLAAAGLLIEGADPPELLAAANRLGIPVIRVRSEGGPSGPELDGERLRTEADQYPAGSDDVALILPTSGTTSLPKLVPLTHSNLRAGAAHVAQTLLLGPADIGLNMMPLFHIHGIVAGLLAPLLAGGRSVTAPGLEPRKLPGWLDEHRPTFISCVPTMHHGLLRAASRGALKSGLASLRVLRSSSAPLPSALWEKLEAEFGVPVLQAYAMTEASHQMASNGLGLGMRRIGTVGRAAGASVRILAANGSEVTPGRAGEIVVKGPGVITGYLSPPDANEDAFADGWLRTGDQGRFDDDGFLVLTGRLKEMINRGGEKISPLEVEEVLLRHPEVSQAAVFAIPHPTLGETVAAVIVPTVEGADPASLEDFASSRLAGFKVPRTIVLRPTIPIGPTGKVQRMRLADQLGLAPAEPSPALEMQVADTMAHVLDRPTIDPSKSFFLQGGDSIAAAEVAAMLSDLYDSDFDPEDLFADGPSPAAVAGVLARLGIVPASERSASGPVTQLAEGDPAHLPLIWILAHPLQLVWVKRMVRETVYPGKVFALMSQATGRTTSLDEIVNSHLEVLRSLGIAPVRLGGMCFGATVVVRLAAELGDSVESLVLVDPFAIGPNFRGRLEYHSAAMRLAGRSNHLRDRIAARLHGFFTKGPVDSEPMANDKMIAAHREYRPTVSVDQVALLIETSPYAGANRHSKHPWHQVLRNVRQRELRQLHSNLYEEAAIVTIAAWIGDFMAELIKAGSVLG